MEKNILMAGSGGVTPGLYFFGVTQGESVLLALPTGVTVLTDAGSDAGIVDDLQKVLPPSAPSYIDLAIISSPEAGNYEGYQYLLQHFQIGAFIDNGRTDTAKSTEWQELMGEIAANTFHLSRSMQGIASVMVPRQRYDILSPDATFAHSPDPSDTGLVEQIITPTFTALLAADIGTNVENALLAAKNNGLPINFATKVLKAPFPGLGTAAGDAFLNAVAPHAIVIKPGAKSTASAPTKAMLAHLASSSNAVISSPKPSSFLLYNK